MLLLDISSWWGELSTILKIYWSIAIPATILLVFLLSATLIGGDVDGDISDVDLEIEGDGGIGFQFISVKTIVSFFAVFGWSGIACVDAGLGTVPTLLISIACGIGMMFLIAGLVWGLMQLTSSGTLKMKNAIGKLGEVYLVVPAKRGGFGKVQLNIQGSLRELEALTDDESSLNTGTIVRVLSVIDDHILVVTNSKN